MTLAIAIVALLATCYAVFVAVRTQAAVNEWIDAQAEEGDEEEEAQELWLSEGEFYSADKAALEAKFPDALGFVMCEGVPSAVTATGVWSLHKLLTDKPSVRSIK